MRFDPMMHPAKPPRTLEEQMELYPGPYTYETQLYWVGWNKFSKRFRWTVFIKQKNCPWFIVDCSGDFRYEWQAVRWAEKWLKTHG